MTGNIHRATPTTRKSLEAEYLKLFSKKGLLPSKSEDDERVFKEPSALEPVETETSYGIEGVFYTIPVA